MELITILNHCHHFPGFVYAHARFNQQDRTIIEIAVRPRQGSRAICSGCHQPAPGYDHMTERRFEFIPFWGFLVFLLYRMRRVNCRACGVTVEEVPWASGKHQLTNAYMLFLAHWARKLSWKETALSFRTSWEKVCHAVEYVVAWGLEHRSLEGINAIGVDEIQYAKGHKYLTLVYQIDAGAARLLWIGAERTVATFEQFFVMLGPERSAQIQFVCSDMWKPYLKVIREKCSQALHILDRFHVVAKMNEALDDVRAAEARRLVQAGHEPLLKKSRWCVLKRRENLSDHQQVHLRWDLTSMLDMAVAERVIPVSPAGSLYTPKSAKRSESYAMSAEEVELALGAVEQREKVILRLAIFAGMRPGELLAIQRDQVSPDASVIEIRQRVYRGKFASPKNGLVRKAAIPPDTASHLREWLENAVEPGPESFVFAGESGQPLWRSSLLEDYIKAKLDPVGLGWVNFQVMRRTHASLGHEAKVDPKVSADQRGHGIGVALDVYTKSSMKDRAAAAKRLEDSVKSKPARPRKRSA